MSDNISQFTARISSLFAVFLLAALVEATPAIAQKVVTQDAGGGRKIELQYNAAGEVVETRTIGADGKLLEKDSLEYAAGALVPNSLSTSYWPNGQKHKITHNTYDQNSNFTGEFVDIFDDSGKQIGGHKLVHDPASNGYTCTAWDEAAHAFKSIDCPAGEEASGTPETVKTFTAEEVQQQLAHAREPQQPPRHAGPPPPPPVGVNVKEVGLVLPASVAAGGRVSGSVVDNPADFEGSPEVFVTRFALPFPPSGKAANLPGWLVEVHGEPTQTADSPIVISVPAGRPELSVLFRPADGSGAPVAKTIAFPRGNTSQHGKASAGASYLAPALCVKGQLCAVHGQFTGDSRKTFAAFETRPAKIVAETSDVVYLAIPIDTEPGPRPMVVQEGAKAFAFPMIVAEFTLKPERRDLAKGATLLMYARIEGAGDVPDPEWRPGNFPPSNLELARQALPGYQPAGAGSAHDKREAHEAEERREKEQRAAAKSGEKDKSPDKDAEEKEGGELLLVVKNLAPDAASFRGSKDGRFVFHLNAASFERGDFQYKFVVEGRQTGNFGVQGWLIPFLAPVKAQEFPVSATTTN